MGMRRLMEIMNGMISDDDSDGMPRSLRKPDQPVYLRVGTWNPKYPYSQNYATGDREYGLSVYALDAHGQPVVPEEGEWAEEDLRDRLRSEGPFFLVQGDVAGWGGDGEPVLSNPVVVGRWKRD